jgi:hypothetical protein
VAGNVETTFAPARGAQSTQHYAENVNRLGTYADAVLQGLDPAAAAERVVAAHHDFSRLTPFERNVMRRIAPFYSWSRANLPVMAGELATNPGGRMGTTMRVLNEMAGNNRGFVPENVSQTGELIPVGGQENGRQSYLTSLGLPFEDLVGAGSLNQLVGQMSPALKVPLELAMGRQFYSGRELPANYPLPGMTVANELIGASPASRLMSYAREWMDPNRPYWQTALHQLAGPRITSVDVEKARSQAIRQYAEEQLRNTPEASTYSRMYVPREMMGQLTPAELALLRLYQTAGRAR